MITDSFSQPVWPVWVFTTHALRW